VSLLLGLGLATGAFAHASLIATEPTDGSIVPLAPTTVKLRFNEAVTPVTIRLIDAEGRARDDALVRVLDDTISIKLPERLPRGTQTVSYRVISADGHPVGGALVFSIGASTATTPAPRAGAARGTTAGLIWLARVGVYLGLFVGIGAVFFVCWIAPVPGLRLIRPALGLGLGSAAFSLGLQGLDVLDLPLAAIVSPAPWRAAFGTSLGPALAIAVAAMLAGWWALSSPLKQFARALSGLAMVGVGLSLAASGHAANAPPHWLSRPALLLHGIGVAYWIGALAPLITLARRPADGLVSVLHRFSSPAMPLLALLVLTGLPLSALQLQGLGSIQETCYGRILLVKLMLVAVLLALAWLNRFRLTPALAVFPDETTTLRRSILAEGALALGILAVVALWRFTPPPRALVAEVMKPLAFHLHTGQATAEIEVSPGIPGTDRMAVRLMNSEMGPLLAKQVLVSLSLPERGIEALERMAELSADGAWYVHDAPLPYPGHWQLRIDALISDFQNITLEQGFDLPAR
jgi:copper transport protein